MGDSCLRSDAVPPSNVNVISSSLSRKSESSCPPWGHIGCRLINSCGQGAEDAEPVIVNIARPPLRPRNSGSYQKKYIDLNNSPTFQLHPLSGFDQGSHVLLESYLVCVDFVDLQAFDNILGGRQQLVHSRVGVRGIQIKQLKTKKLESLEKILFIMYRVYVALKMVCKGP